MTKELLKKIIEDQKLFLRQKIFASRIATDIVANQFDNKKIIFISGVRRCGKTCEMKTIRKNVPSYYVFNFKDSRLENLDATHLDMLYEALIEMYGEEQLFYFEEIQQIEGWEKFVLNLQKEGRKVIITNSGKIIFHPKFKMRFVGKYVNYELFPLSFPEFLQLKNHVVDKNDFDSTLKVSLLKKAFLTHLRLGGFPEYIKSGNVDFLMDLYNNILYKDIITKNKLRNDKAVKKLMNHLMSNISKEISYNAAKSVIGVSNALTVKEYIGFLEESFLLFSINKYDSSYKKQLINAKKIYAIDNGLCSTLSMEFKEDKKAQLINLIFLELRKQYERIFYHKNKFECDFLVFDLEKAQEAIQVEWDLSNKKVYEKSLRGLMEAMKEHNLDKGTLITFEEEKELNILGKKITIVPAWKWLLGV